jgi:RNA polymerase sigma-70 factor (ECF subfamily)
MEASELGPALHTAVEGLPSEQRRALELRVVQQLSYDEVAGRLGCSQNAARLRVSRALRTLTLELGRAEGSAG